MKICFDYQILTGQKYGGISRYYYELIERLRAMQNVEVDLKCLFNRNAYFEKEFGMRKKYWMGGIGENYLNRINTIRQLKKKDYDIVHPTYYDPYIIGKSKGKLVVTVYDMIHEVFPEHNAGNPITENKKKMIFAADHIIAISESTKRDILKIYPDIPEEKITVIYISSNFNPVSSAQPDERFPAKYVLFVGRRDSYKNYKIFFEAVKPILEEDPELHVVCIGGGPFSEEELAAQGSLAGRVHQLDANDSVLSYAYSNAQCFVFPSQYEGFGIPTLEAFACNCPVVLSKTSSMPEVGGDAVVYIDPLDRDDIRNQIQKLLNDSKLREELIEKGKHRLALFNWDDIARETLACYNKVLKLPTLKIPSEP